MPERRDIYTAIIYYRGQSGASKLRPVVILNELENNIVTIAEITSVPPKKNPGFYDKFKEEIVNWEKCGLAEPSWVKCFKENTHNINIGRLHDKIGVMDSQDFENAVMNMYYNN
ncbi:type II toxin-antitoxin system PemK/MazF family toxin [Desulfosporosinus sp. BICA1-9]|uniref:type II toxin-antitoxin system PemK/MazF family toxin n=1 Tax=Desulfosporosinus sp. BICA1-9 TaxID=1531958 RepID=UPI00054BC0A1|nr:type II toxin-antitoxin system PemK/MazF family toxin [Desulfosporosinus sp. BICA1-9]KJS49698.1 MAG: hypothetical protein VR66_07040 [Peptococcaceae bacterium BRH_c23]KJS90055.1 MAG: hypothetical protein JL57_03705 [Desulfosporosinus sp. BICA1-9]HBW38769.1 hypothetical protein [Desulfosporosinus sp.]